MRFTFSPRQTNVPLDLTLLRVNNSLTCGITGTNDTHVWVDINFDACNTTMEMTSHYINRNAMVEVLGAEPNNSITRSMIGVVARYSVSCHYNRSQNVSSNDGLNATGVAAKSVEPRHVSSLADLDLTMDFFRDATLADRLISPSVEIGEPMYLAITNQNPNGFKILVDTCFASPSSDPSDKSLHYMFFNEGCSYDESFNILTSSDDLNYGFGFKIDAFIFIKRQRQV